MPHPLAPGAFVEEVRANIVRITGVRTGTAAFVGPTALGATEGTPPLLTSYDDFARLHGVAAGNTAPVDFMAQAARAFFAEGGSRLYVTRLADPGPAAWDAAFARLAAIDEIALVAAPGASALDEPARVAANARVVAFAESAGLFALIDPPPGLDPAGVQAVRGAIDSRNAALYYPWIVTLPASGIGDPVKVPPSGAMAGIFARIDAQSGVWKAPANAPVRSAVGLERTITDTDQAALNPLGINCLRAFPGRGILVWGARTTSSDPEWRYVNVRRYLLYLQRSLSHGLAAVAFEPNGASLWTSVVAATNDFLMREWRGGALQGSKAQDAFYVRCEPTTMTAGDIAHGRLMLLVGVAPLKPAEFIMFRTTLATAAST